jgi:hypothetical protein
MTEQNQSLQSDHGVTSFRPSDFGVRDLPYILVALAALTGLGLAIDWVANLLSHDLRLFLGGLAAGWLLSACLTAWRDRRRRTSRPPGAPLSERVKELARGPDHKLEAIRVYREETGAGLAEAKTAIEGYLDSLTERLPGKNG